MLIWSLKLDCELLCQVPGLPLAGKLSLILKKYACYLSGRFAGPERGSHSLMVFGASFCYNEALGPASLQRVYCAGHTLKGYLPAHPVIIDVGANVGQFNFFGRKYLGARRIVSIEPVRECYQLLLQNAQVGADCLCCAVSNQERELLFHVAQESSQLSSYLPDEDACYRESYAVPVRSLDSIAAELVLERIDLLKIDTEGSEFDVLKSAENLLSRTDLILIEMSVFRKSAGNLFRIGQFLEEKGFALVELSGGEGRRPKDLDAVFRRV